MNRLREARFIRRMTQMVVYQRTGIWPSKLSAIENGFIPPADEEKKQLSALLEMEEHWLFPESATDLGDPHDS